MIDQFICFPNASEQIHIYINSKLKLCEDQNGFFCNIAGSFILKIKISKSSIKYIKYKIFYEDD